MGPKAKKRVREGQNYPKYGFCMNCTWFGDGKGVGCGCECDKVVFYIQDAIAVLGGADVPSPNLLSLGQVKQLLQAKVDVGKLPENAPAEFVFRVKQNPNHRYNKKNVERKLAVLAEAREVILVGQQEESRDAPKGVIGSRQSFISKMGWDSDEDVATIGMEGTEDWPEEERNAFLDMMFNDVRSVGGDAESDEADEDDAD